MFLLYIKRNIFFTQWLYGYVKVTLKLSCKDIPGSMISRESSIEMRKKKKKKKKNREFKGPWHASAHVLHFDFWSGEPFFKIGFWWKNPFSLTLRRPRKVLYHYSRAIWFILEVLNAIFCILRQALSRKFEVIEEKCTKAYYLLSAFLQADQMWRLMWSSGFHFCLLSSPVNDLPFSVKY